MYKLKTLSRIPSLFGVCLSVFIMVGCGGTAEEPAEIESGSASLGSGSVSEGEGKPVPEYDAKELQKAKEFVQQLEFVKDELHLSANANSNKSLSGAFMQSVTPDLNKMLEITGAGLLMSAIVSYPRMALDSACDTFQSLVVKNLCSQSLSGENLAALCALFESYLPQDDQLSQRVCNRLDALSFDLGDSLVVDVSLVDGEVSISGEYNGHSVDIFIVSTLSDVSRYTFGISGTIQSDQAVLSFGDSQIVVQLETIDGMGQLAIPSSVQGEFEIQFQQFQSDEITNPINLTGRVLIDSTITPLVSKLSDPNSLQLNDLKANVVVEARVETANGELYNVSVIVDTSQEEFLDINIEILTGDSESTTVSVIASLDELTEGFVDVVVRRNGEEYIVHVDFKDLNRVLVKTDDGFEIKVDFGRELDDVIGNLSVNGVSYGEIGSTNQGQLSFDYLDGSTFTM